MTSFLFWLAIIGLAASALFSTLSYALRMMSRVTLEAQLKRFHRSESLEEILELRHELALSASTLRLLANIIVIMAAGMYFQVSFSENQAAAGDGAGAQVRQAWKIFGLSLLFSTPALLIASVAIPQAWARYAGEWLIASTWPIIRGAHWLLTPLVVVTNLVDEMVRRLSGVKLDDDGDDESVQVGQEILAVVEEGTAEGTVDEEQKKMIEAVIAFGDLQAGQIMTPRTEIVALDVNAPLTEVREKVMADGLSRVPVYEGSLDTVVGTLYAKDLLALLGQAAPEKFDLRNYLRPPLFVPRTKPVRDLLKDFRTQQVHMAVVLDEYGGTSGLVTSEDVIEKIVGDIADEYERPEPEELKRVDERTVEVDATMNVGDLNRALELKLPEDQDYQTVGGFVTHLLGAIPVKGERVEYAPGEGEEKDKNKMVITVLDAEPRRAKKLRLEIPARQES